jgi:RNA ligase (TIGR02306 family)
MSNFECPVVKVRIEPHPNADAIEIARVGDFQSIVKKGQFQDGDFAVYIPEQAVVPVWMLREMGMYDEEREKGGLAGPLGNRVKAIKLRGVVSQGLIFPIHQCGPFPNETPEDLYDYYRDNPEDAFTPTAERYRGGDDDAWDPIENPDGTNNKPFEHLKVKEGDNIADFFGVIKYEPKIPSHMAGRIIGADFDATAKYDFDNLKKTPELFEDGEEVVITEKIHGTLLQIGVMPASQENEKYYGGRVVISSKGMGAKGFVLDHEDETNLYAQAAKKHGLLDIALNLLTFVADTHDKPVFVFGEVFGRTASGAGVQDLTYTNDTLDFRVFDLCVGNRGHERYSHQDDLEEFLEDSGLQQAPVLYRGPYSKEVVLEHTNGKTTLAENSHIREGVVVKSATEEYHPRYGRKVAKSVSDAYLLRKGETTEFQ